MKLFKILPIIGILIFIAIIYDTGIDKLTTALSEIHPIYLITALAILIPRTLIVTKKWEYVIKKQDINVPYSFVIKAYFIAVFYGSITPGWIGTYIRIPYLMKKGNISLGKATSNLVIDTLIDVISLLIIVLIGTIIVSSKFPNLAPIISLLFVAVISLVIYFSNKKRSEKYFKIVLKFLVPSKYKKDINCHFDAFYESIPKFKFFVMPIVACIVCWILAYTQVYLMAQGLGINLEYFYFILIYPVVFLIELLPVSISGLGTRELVLATLFSGFAFAGDKIIILSLSGYFVTVLIPAIIGAILALRDIRKTKSIEEPLV